MATKHESYTWKSIEKDISPRALDRGGNRLLPPGTAIEIINGRPTSSDGGYDGSLESIKGTTAITNGSLPAGTNTVIGSYEDVQFNSLIFFVHNSNTDHCLFRYKEDGSVVLLLQWSGLFSTTALITAIGMDEDVLFYTDGVGETRAINLTDAEAGNYTTPTEVVLSLVKKPPKYAPTFTVYLDADVGLPNRISDGNFQFAYRFVFKDGESSALSPYSAMKLAIEEPNPFGAALDNSITVVTQIHQDLIQTGPFSIVDYIQVFFREGNTGDWKWYENVDSPDLTTPTNSNNTDFYNDKAGFTLSDDELLIGPETIPSKSNALAMFNDRIFVNRASIGLDVNDRTGNMHVALNATPSVYGAGSLKEGGIYEAGLVYFDEFGRRSLVDKFRFLNGSLNLVDSPIIVAEVQSVDETNIFTASRWHIRADLTSATPPPWATNYRMAVKRNQFQDQWMQTPCHFVFLSRIKEPGDTPGASEVEDNGYMWYKDLPTSFSIEGGNKIYIHLPVNLPFVPEVGMFVKIKSDTSITVVEPIIEVFGDFIVVGGFGITDWTVPAYEHLIEIFSVKENQDDIFYEVGPVFDVVGGAFGTTSIRVPGDTHVVTPDAGNASAWLFLDYRLNDDSISINYRGTFGNILGYSPGGTIESPSPAFTQRKEFVTGAQPSSLPFKVIDYEKIADHGGRSSLLQYYDAVSEEKNAIAFSDPRIQDSDINGLSSFSSVNKYSIPNELSPLVHFAPIGNNVMLAIHERETTSITISEGYIRQGDDSILAKTEGVVGDNRNLLGSFGTIHPESVKVIEGLAFYYDIHKGAIVRYASNGLFPVSDYGMKAFFYKKSQNYIANKSTLKFPAGIDRYHNEYIITFPTDGGETQETWAFNYVENRWVYRAEYYPEYFGQLGNQLFSFLSGAMYLHNDSSTYNNFHGNQRERSVKFYVNPEVTKPKKLLNIHLHADQLADDELELKRDTFVPSNPNSTKRVVLITTEDISNRPGQPGQDTFIEVGEFEIEEGIYYGQVFRDQLAANPPGGLVTREGEHMRAQYFVVEIVSDITDIPARLHSAKLVWVDSDYSK